MADGSVLRLGKSEYAGYEVIFTDGSKQGCGVRVAACTREQVKTEFLSMVASMYPAETMTVHLNLGIAESGQASHFVITSDSQTAIKASPTQQIEVNLYSGYVSSSVA